MPQVIETRIMPVAGSQPYLAELFVRSLSTADVCPKHKINQANAAKKFLEYMATKEPVKSWDEWLMSDHIGEYLEHLKEQGLSANTMRSYANVFRLVNRTVYRKTRQPKAEVQAYLPKRKGQVQKNYLVLPKLLRAIDAAREAGNLRAELGFTLGGFMGLRLEEIAYLCKSDYHEDEQTLFIYDSKNEYSTRTLPVPSMCRDVLKKAFAYRDVLRRREDPRNALYETSESIARQMRAVTRALYAETQDPAYDGRVKPMDARKAFKAICDQEKIDWWLVEVYMGHKLPGESESYHALRVTAKSLPEIREKAIAVLREIPDTIEAAAKSQN